MHRRKRRGNPGPFDAFNFNLLSNINYLILGGDGGIRTLDRALQPYNGLANRDIKGLSTAPLQCILLIIHVFLFCDRREISEQNEHIAV